MEIIRLNSQSGDSFMMLNYKNFEGTAIYYENDNYYFGKILGAAGLWNYGGATIEELEQDFRDSVEEYLKDLDKE